MRKPISHIRLSEVANFRNGLNFSKESHGNGCLLVGIPDFRNRFTPDYKSLNEINPDGIARPDDYLQKGDIVFVRSNGNKALVGRSLYFDRDVKALFSGFCIRARIFDDKLDSMFCAYFTKTTTFRASIASSAGTNINNLNQGILGDAKIPLFPKNQQRAIASLLGALDQKIELNNQINQELEGLAKLLYDYWFVQFDFPISAAQAAAMGNPGLEGKPYRASGGKMIYNEALKREIPEGWLGGTLEDVLTLQYGKALKKDIQIPGDYPVYGSGGIYGYHNVPLVKGPGVIVGRKGSVGEIHWSNEDFYPTDTSYYVEPKAGIDLNYAYFLLQSLPLKSMNSDSAVPGLSRNAAYRLPATLPDMALVIDFGNFVAPLRASIANNEQQTQELTALRDWLLPMLMNGQVSVG